MNYKLIRFTSDEKIKGKGDNHTVRVCSELNEYRINYKMIDYVANFETFTKNLPSNISGTLIKKKGVIDFMQASPFIIGLEMIVSEMFINLLKELKISKNEYFEKLINIEGFVDKFYLLFFPLITIDKVIWRKSIIYKGFLSKKEEREYVTINSIDEYKNHEKLTFEKIVLPHSFFCNDMIYLQGCGLVFSERLFNSIIEKKIIGIEESFIKELIVDEDGLDT